MILCNAWEYLSTCWKWGGRGANQRGHRSLSLENITHKWHSCFSIFFKTKCLNTDPSSPKMFPCFHLWNTPCMEVQSSAQRREELNCRFVSWSLQKEQKEGGHSTSNRVLPNPCFNLNRQEKALRRFDNRVFDPTPVFEFVCSCGVIFSPSWSVQTF